jgi:iron complex outermembrane receptor protein
MRTNMKPTKIALAISLMFAGAAGADDAVQVPDVLVTAHPIIEEVQVDAYSSTSAVVTENQLRDQNAVDLTAALRRTPGVQISRYNPVGAYGGDQGGAVFIRGMGISRPGSEIKTYVDGVPLYVGVWGHPAIDLLPINGMESITVYKSPQPQINGNNFASINLQTKLAREDGVHGDARLSAGSFGTVAEQINILGKQGPVDFMLAQGYATSNGERKNAEGDLRNAMGKLGIQFNEHWKASFGFIWANNNVNDPGDSRVAAPAITPEYKSRTGMVTAALSHQHGDWNGEFKIYHNDGQSDLHDDTTWGTFISGFSMSGLRWNETFSPWTGGSVTAGLDIDRISGDVKGAFTGGKVDMPDFRLTSPHLALSQTVKLNDDWSLVPAVGARFYDHNKFESKTAPHAGLSLVSDKVTVFANVSRGINYPGLEAPALQAALPFMFAGTTWQQLSPEESIHQEIGVKFAPTTSTQVDVSLFSDKIKNRYVYDLAFGSTAYYNTGGYRMNGAELSVKQNITSNWVVFGGLTLLDPNIDHLPYTPDKAVTAGLNGQIGPLKVAIDAQYQDEVWALNKSRDTLSPNTTKVGAFAIVNARLSYPLTSLGKKGEVFLAVENLFDRDYEYRPGYQMPGISGQLGLSASF